MTLQSDSQDTQPEIPDSPVPLSVSILHWGLIAAATVLPWAAHFLAGWWAGPVVWIALITVYHKLFVPKDSFCSGIPFMVPLSSFMALLYMNLYLLVKWLRS